MASSVTGQDNQIARCDWLFLPERARSSYLARSGLPAVFHEKKFSQKPRNKSFFDEVFSAKMAGYWPGSFLRVYGPRLRLGPHA